MTYPHYIDSKTSHGTVVYEFKSSKVYYAYREKLREEIDRGYGITADLIRAGYVSYSSRMVADKVEGNAVYGLKGFTWVECKIRPNENWYGVSLYHPDWLFIKGAKSVLFSLQGVCSRYIDDEQVKKMFENRSVKYICFTDKEETIYETHEGKLPDKNIMEYFLK